MGSDIALPVDNGVQKKAGWAQLFSRTWRKNAFVGAAFYFCQVIPFFALGTFIPRVLEAIKVENTEAGSIIYNIFLFVGILAGFWVVDKISRRAFLIGSFYFCAAVLLVLFNLFVDVIYTLLCREEVCFADIEARHAVGFGSHFSRELEALKHWEELRLVRRLPDRLTVTDTGRFYLRQICRVFDRRLAEKEYRVVGP